MNISFFVEGPCVPKGRPRVTRSGHTYTPKRTKDYESTVAWAAKDAMRQAFATFGQIAMPTQMPVRVDLVIYPKDKRLSDIDNCAKSILDAMNGIVYMDDKQVNILLINRMDLGSKVGVHVEVEW